jgi:hypothetical protein
MDQFDWLRLSDALTMISARVSGLTETEKKLVICEWISNHKVDVRLTLHGGQVLVGLDIHVPAHLQSDDFDWYQSRPVKPRPARLAAAGRYVLERAGQSPEGQERDITLIELRAGQLCSALDESAHRFDEKPVWQIRELLQLLLNPDRAGFGLAVDDDLRMAVRYKHGRRAMIAVLHKLQRGLLIAHENGKPLPQIHWINKTQRDIFAELDLQIFADNALAIWPKLRNIPETGRQLEAIPVLGEVLEPDTTEDQLLRANDRRVYEVITPVYDKAHADGEKRPIVDPSGVSGSLANDSVVRLAEWIFAQHPRDAS